MFQGIPLLAKFESHSLRQFLFHMINVKLRKKKMSVIVSLFFVLKYSGYNKILSEVTEINRKFVSTLNLPVITSDVLIMGFNN